MIHTVLVKLALNLVATSYKNLFSILNTLKLASVRAGNVIGGGDWAENRLFPDIIRAYLQTVLYVFGTKMLSVRGNTFWILYMDISF